MIIYLLIPLLASDVQTLAAFALFNALSRRGVICCFSDNGDDPSSFRTLETAQDAAAPGPRLPGTAQSILITAAPKHSSLRRLSTRSLRSGCGVNRLSAYSRVRSEQGL